MKKVKCPKCGKKCELHVYGKDYPYAIAIHEQKLDSLGLFINVTKSCTIATRAEFEQLVKGDR